MRNIHLLKFSFGTNVYRNIPIDQLKYFATFFSKFFNLEFLVDECHDEDLKTIPISYKRISKNADILARKLIDSLMTELRLIDTNKKFHNINDLIVVDIKSNIRDTALIHLSSEIENILKSDSDNPSPRFVLILEDIPASIKNFFSIENYINTGKVFLIDKKKRFRYKDEQVKVNKEFSFDLLTKSSLDRTKFKLIRKIGHYGRYKDNSKKELVACNQFFYDGSDCKNDISDVLFDKIASLKDENSFDPTIIVFDCPESPWLAESISFLDSELKTLKADYSFSYTGYKNISEIKGISLEVESILFVIPLIHTGTVFKKCYNSLRDKFPNANIKSISILVSDTEGLFIKVNELIAEIEVNQDEKVSIDFFLSVNQKHYPVHGQCPMCNGLHMEIIKDSSYINEDVLTSFEVWTMCDEAGYCKEDFVTDREKNYPKQVPLLPNRLELIKKNSAYLALKYKKHIERNHLLESPDLILVFPDERTSIKELKLRNTKSIALEETASGYFAETLIQLQDIEYFGIPRNILDKIHIANGKPSDLTFIQREYGDFYSKLRLLSDDIIIMDEFGLSGTTLKKIIAILDFVNKKPKAYFPIFNFNPRYLNNESFDSFSVLSLYDFNIHK